MIRLGTDSGEYDLLSRAAASVMNMDGLSIEIGLREGGGSQYMIEQLFESTMPDKIHVAIDPYGSLPYEWQEGKIAGWIYDDRMRNQALSSLYGLTSGTNVNFIFFNLTDDQFFKRFSDGIPVFTKGKEVLINEYSLVHLDAVHSVAAINKQVDFFAPRMKQNAIVVIDDITEYYDTSKVEENLFKHGFKVFEKGTKKGAYVKE